MTTASRPHQTARTRERVIASPNYERLLMVLHAIDGNSLHLSPGFRREWRGCAANLAWELSRRGVTAPPLRAE
jgi:hypothetical protein